MKFFRDIYADLQSAREQMAYEQRIERAIRISGNVIRLANIDVSQKEPKQSVIQGLGDKAMGQLMLHPANNDLDMITDPKFYSDKWQDHDQDGPHDAQIIPLPMDATAQSAPDNETMGKLVIMPSRRVYMRSASNYR